VLFGGRGPVGRDGGRLGPCDTFAPGRRVHLDQQYRGWNLWDGTRSVLAVSSRYVAAIEEE
jgi:hypothetical protein